MAVDHVAWLVGKLSAAYPWEVHAMISPQWRVRTLPTIVVDSVGVSERHLSLNTVGLDSEDLEVELLVAAGDLESGDALRWAFLLRQDLLRLRDGPVRVLDITRPAVRPERNSKIKRVGMTLTVVSPA